MISRRKFLTALAASGGLAPLAPELLASTQRPRGRGGAAIDRAALVGRHDPVVRRLDPLAPLSVGNGEFAFTADVTGLQTFPEEYESQMPLCTMSQWGWHTSPLPAGLEGKELRLTQYDTHGRQVGYHTSSEGQKELFDWLRENPHRLHLGRVGLYLDGPDGGELKPSDITDIEQRLDLWSGILTSRFSVRGVPVTVRTAVHPGQDVLAVSIESPHVRNGLLGVRFAFPYASPSMSAADWQHPERHRTELTRRPNIGLELRRTLDADEYFVTLVFAGRVLGKEREEGEHQLSVTSGDHASRFEFAAAFSPRRLTQAPPHASVVFDASAAHWQRFWTTGGAVELADSRDVRAPELERRVVLSQYLTAIQCSGSLPPQETGLTVNSWYGKFHLEMHWWHAAHFALWDRLPLLERSLGWYEKVLPSARERARQQGYAGARWPKMTAPDGRDSPSPIGPLLIWEQPHPIFYAELCYRSRPTRRTLERYRSVVFETAEFMASYAFFDQRAGRYVLGPPVIPAQENHPARETWNPTYELSYWRFGLRAAQAWRERLGMKREPKWDDVLARLSPLPAREGVYLAHENCPQTYTERNRDHPSMLAAYGVLPGDGVERETMRRTLSKVFKEWQWDDTWGWDYPMTAMTAARLGDGRAAVGALLLETPKNRYLPNGHNYQRPNLPLYLPGNGGLLYAVALMAGGWRDAPRAHAPGFPSDGTWTVRHEGLSYGLLKTL
ncbi:MAG TPA: twin-arginine translocation signal domain-containing protein [Pyrinomonadaceae bacterium]|nr:twin-arginine translocation signal domain-containing protein [Pyrinomonadaceae bacterium]